MRSVKVNVDLYLTVRLQQVRVGLCLGSAASKSTLLRVYPCQVRTPTYGNHKATGLVLFTLQHAHTLLSDTSGKAWASECGCPRDNCSCCGQNIY